MRLWLLILAGWANAVDIGSISELRGNGEVVRQGTTDKLLAELALGIASYDDVRTGNGRMAIEFLDSSVVRLTEHSKIIIDDFVYDPDPFPVTRLRNMTMCLQAPKARITVDDASLLDNAIRRTSDAVWTATRLG